MDFTFEDTQGNTLVIPEEVKGILDKYNPTHSSVLTTYFFKLASLKERHSEQPAIQLVDELSTQLSEKQLVHYENYKVNKAIKDAYHGEGGAKRILKSRIDLTTNEGISLDDLLKLEKSFGINPDAFHSWGYAGAFGNKNDEMIKACFYYYEYNSDRRPTHVNFIPKNLKTIS